MLKAGRSLRIARIYATHAIRRIISVPEMLADLIEKHALRH
jgi:hypothetical protein